MKEETMSVARRGKEFIDWFIENGEFESRQNLNEGKFETDAILDEIWIMDGEEEVTKIAVQNLPVKDIKVFEYLKGWMSEEVKAFVDETNNIAYFHYN